MAGHPPDSARSSSFPVTHWTWIRQDPAALEHLARLYWKPIRAYLRAALGRDDDEALELTQDFFVWAIETGFLAKANPARGRFRAFLKTALRNYAAKAAERAAALKRGGGARFVSLGEGDEGEDAWPALRDERALAPEEILDDAWRAAVVRAAVDRTRAELEGEGRGAVFEVFRDWFLDERAGESHRAIAARHGIDTVDVANHLARAKRCYRAHLVALVRDTVGSGAELDEELAWLTGGARP